MSNEKKVPVTEEDVYSTKGRWPVFIKLMAVAGIAAALGELVGTVKFPVGPGNVILLPMIFAMIFAVLVTPDALGSKIEALKKICGEKEVKLSESMLTLVLIILGIKLGMSAGPNIEKVIAAGPALIRQEFGILGSLVHRPADCHAAGNAPGSGGLYPVHLPRAYPGPHRRDLCHLFPRGSGCYGYLYGG